MQVVCLLLLCLHGIFADPYETGQVFFPYVNANPSDTPLYYDYSETTQDPLEDQQQQQQQQQQEWEVDQYQLQPQQQVLDTYQYQPQQQQQQIQQEIIPVPTLDYTVTEPTEPGPLDCREEQYPCTRLYSVHKPCKQCLNEICFYSLRRMYVVNKEICVRTVCAHEELLRADLCRDTFSRCGVMASSGMCQSVGPQCSKSCGGC
ncbi:microfibrillar-associated protein 2 [Ascaphus truei]|uniref:microfibrillar-associated protein 2 n=1 Tax=Ascaphus truei TaxID=8439 RepID=UPI003F5A6F59